MRKVLLAGFLLCILAAALAGIGCDLFSAGLTPGTQPPPPGNNAPTASAQATTSTNINEGESVSFSAAASSDSDGTIVSYGWDADNDGVYDDATGVSPTITFNTAGTFNVDVRVVDNGGASDTLNTTLTVVVTGAINYDLSKLNAVASTTVPVIDGVADDAVWADAPELTIPLGDGMETFSCGTCHSQMSATTVTLKAARTGSNITVLASWPDATASFTRGGSWSFENATWEKPNSGQGEDRIAFFWPIGAIGGDDYDTGGCMTKCHTDGNGAYLLSGTGDMWHTKAARSGPVTSATGSNLVIDPVTYEVTGGTVSTLGFVDDKNVGPDRPLDEDRGRYGDAGSSTYSHNRIDDKSRPKYMETNPTDFMDAMVLTQSEIDGGEVVGDGTTGVSDADAATYWAAYAGFGAVVPERILRDPVGSRGDITIGAVWENGFWTVELTRALDTGNVDDIAFAIDGEYQFGVAVMENAGGTAHKASEQFTLRVY